MPSYFKSASPSSRLLADTSYQSSPNLNQDVEEILETAAARRGSHHTRISMEHNYSDKEWEAALAELESETVKRRRSASAGLPRSVWPMAWRNKSISLPSSHSRSQRKGVKSFLNRRLVLTILMTLFFAACLVLAVVEESAGPVEGAEFSSAPAESSWTNPSHSSAGDASSTGTDRWTTAPGRWKHKVKGWGVQAWESAHEKLQYANEHIAGSISPGRIAEKLGVVSSSKKAPYVRKLNMLQIFNYNTPQDSLEKQMKKGVRYATTIAYGGHANQIISIERLLYLAKITNRVAILPTLTPGLVRGGSEDLSTFYDIDRLVLESSIPAVEWSKVKGLTEERTEDIACWSIAEATIGEAQRNTWSLDYHGMKTTHWPLPPLEKGMGGFDVSFDAMRIFDFDDNAQGRWIDEVREKSLPQKKLPSGEEIPLNMTEARLKNVKDGFNPGSSIIPSDQMLCLDNTMFIGPMMFMRTQYSDTPLEDYVPGEGYGWMHAGQYLHFNKHLESLADEYLVRLFEVRSLDQVPPFITIHLRRGDFKEFTGHYTPLEAYTQALRKVRARLQERIDNPEGFDGPGRKHFRLHKGYPAATDYRVLATTDEAPDSPFVKEVKALGWVVVDHQALKTEKMLGPWYPSMLDNCLLARGQSFVGTQASTYSHLASVRVKYWQGGLVELA